MARRPGTRGAAGARTSLRHFRQATILAVAITTFLFLLFLPDDPGLAAPAQVAEPAPQIPDTVAIIEEVPVDVLVGEAPAEPAEEPMRADRLVPAALEEAQATALELWYGFLGNLPKVVVVALVFLLAWVAVRVVRPILRRVLRNWERSSATIALAGLAIWFLAIGISVSVLAGDIRALVGSLGLIGLALSWALQTPIESFTGWLLNSFQAYYRVGDRVAVGEVFGDVYQIDYLTTTVWEIGGPGRPVPVQAEQPTGRLITFPNSEVLAGSIVNLTRDFPYVWEELIVPVGNRSDLGYAAEILRRVAADLLGERMAEPTEIYEGILREARLETRVPRQPEVYVSLDDSWTNLTIRYLVPARERRRWTSELAAEVMTELKGAEHKSRIVSVFPRRQIQFIGPDGQAREVPWAEGAPGR